MAESVWSLRDLAHPSALHLVDLVLDTSSAQCSRLQNKNNPSFQDPVKYIKC